MVAPAPFSIKQLDRLIKKNQMVIAKKVVRKPNPKNEEKYNENNKRAHHQKDQFSQSTSIRKSGKKVDLLL
jgi:hypothetical protein